MDCKHITFLKTYIRLDYPMKCPVCPWCEEERPEEQKGLAKKMESEYRKFNMANIDGHFDLSTMYANIAIGEFKKKIDECFEIDTKYESGLIQRDELKKKIENM